MGKWHLYLVRTASGALYTGISTDVDRRLQEHGSDRALGAKCLRARGPLALAYRAEIGSRSLALQAEHRIKRLPKRAKESLVLACPTPSALLEQLGLIASAR